MSDIEHSSITLQDLLPTPYSLPLLYNGDMMELNQRARKLLWVPIGVVFAVSLYLIIVLGIWFLNTDKVMPGVMIAGKSYTGQSDEEIRADLQSRIEAYQAMPGVSEYKLVFDVDKTIANAKGAIANPFRLGSKTEVPLAFSFDAEVMYRKLAEAQKRETVAVTNPIIVKKEEVLSVDPGMVGARVYYGENIFRLQRATGNLLPPPEITIAEIVSAYSAKDLEKNLQLATDLSLRGLTLEYSNQQFVVPQEELASWVSLKSGQSPLGSRLADGYLRVIFENTDGANLFDYQKISNYLATVAKKIDRDPVNATLKIQDGKASIFALSQTGLYLNAGESALEIITALQAGETEVDLTVDVVEPEITQNSLADLGIVELIAEGRSNFAGSPANRRHNIKVGARQFDGILIKPGETFSFTKNLGAVDASTGYLPELVIKDNETVPEYGGGLCQVSSTTFRAALNAGLPIVARRPHAYPVTYYKPYGTDATIYIPNPDLKFTNDTGHHILIQTRIVGNYLYFDFYGTKKSTTVKFAGNKEGTGAVSRIEDVKPYIYDSGVRGEGSFTAVFWQFIYDANGKLISTDDFVSKYDSPLKYPH